MPVIRWIVFGGAVALGAGGTMIAKSIKDSITKEKMDLQSKCNSI